MAGSGAFSILSPGIVRQNPGYAGIASPPWRLPASMRAVCQPPRKESRRCVDRRGWYASGWSRCPSADSAPRLPASRPQRSGTTSGRPSRPARASRPSTRSSSTTRAGRSPTSGPRTSRLSSAARHPRSTRRSTSGSGRRMAAPPCHRAPAAGIAGYGAGDTARASARHGPRPTGRVSTTSNPRVLALVVDDLGLSFESTASVRRMLTRYVESRSSPAISSPSSAPPAASARCSSSPPIGAC